MYVHEKEIQEFLNRNGWTVCDTHDGYASYVKKDNITVDVSDEEIVLIGESGEFCAIPMDYLARYTLLGLMIDHHVLGVDYK